MNEVWKEVKGYEGIYIISNSGVVKSINKKTIRIRKTYKTTKGYLRIVLSKEGKNKTFFVHRLVAVAFIPNPKNKPFINHKNGIKDDNRVENLEWCTCSENHKHAFNEGLREAKKGEDCSYSKITEKDVLYIRENKGKVKQKVLADKFGLSQQQVSRIMRNKRWSHINGEK